MNSKEAMIAEKRLMRATQKNLLGASGKLGLIAKSLGQPIQRQGSVLFDVHYLDDPFDGSDDETIRDFDDDHVVTEGYLFDGTSSGIHIEIKLMNHESKLRVSWQGYTVFEEKAGDLLAYVPAEDWENWVDKLYVRAKNKFAQEVENEKPFLEQDTTRRIDQFIDNLKRKWGEFTGK